MLIEGQVSRLQQKLGNLVMTALRLTPGLGSLAVAQVEGEGDEASRGGIRYRLGINGVTGIAPVQALPTTAAAWFLFNPHGSDVNVFIDSLGEWLVSGTAGAGATVLAAICGTAEIPATVPTITATGVKQVNCNPKSARASKLIVAASQTLLNTPGWSPLAWMNPAGTVLGQTQMVNDDVRGKIMLAPGTGLALTVISPTGTTPLFAPCGTYREYSGEIE